MAFHDFLQDFIDLIMQRGQDEDAEPSEDGINPLDQAAAAIGRGGLRDQAVLQSGQAPITINLEAPKRTGTVGGAKSVNQDATLEALALSRSAQTPDDPRRPNFRSTASRLRNQRLSEGEVRRALRGRQGRSSSPKAN